MTTAGTVTTPSQLLERKAFRLEYLTIGWNIAEGLVAIGAGVTARSIALVGFGFDSFIEVFAATVVVWQLRGVDEEGERRALKLVGGSFFVLAAYVVIESGRDLLIGSRAGPSTPGIVIAALSLLVMPLLARAKRRTAAAMGSATLMADAAETLLCTYLSAILLIGLALNAQLGWWWADSVAALGIAYLAIREGREAWRGEVCC